MDKIQPNQKSRMKLLKIKDYIRIYRWQTFAMQRIDPVIFGVSISVICEFKSCSNSASTNINRED